MADIPYRNSRTGQERLLPEGMGETMGYERVNEFNPPELDESKPEPFMVTTELSDAVDTVLRHFDDENPTGEIGDQLNRIVKKVLAISEVDFEGQEEQTSDGSLISALTKLEAAIEGDDKVSQTAKAAIKKHFATAFDSISTVSNESSEETLNSGSADTAASNSESTTNPKESDLPGKSGDDNTTP